MLQSTFETGKQILNNFSDFHYYFLEKKQINNDNFYTFKVEYIDKLSNSFQTGHIVITFDLNHKITDVNLNIDDEQNFVRPLGSHNDKTLFDLAEKIINSYHGLI